MLVVARRRRRRRRRRRAALLSESERVSRRVVVATAAAAEREMSMRSLSHSSESSMRQGGRGRTGLAGGLTSAAPLGGRGGGSDGRGVGGERLEGGRAGGSELAARGGDRSSSRKRHGVARRRRERRRSRRRGRGVRANGASGGLWGEPQRRKGSRSMSLKRSKKGTEARRVGPLGIWRTARRLSSLSLASWWTAWRACWRALAGALTRVARRTRGSSAPHWTTTARLSAWLWVR
mmetsp:Transcript_12340/g.39262  ORF Transcript_12340/g.39262 Transcript_12340/m.39262 type:complete len:235 (-) Transcript_12340:144-848(-)